MSEVHSQFGGSIADRWMNCPGSVALCASVPELPGSSYAAEGTRAHLLGSTCLEEGVHEAAHSDYPADMCEAVQVYLDAVYEELAASPGAELYVEQKFTFAEIGDGAEVYGSNDAIVYHPSTGRLVVFDYKHGVGVSVSADDNAQLKFYAAGAVLANPTWKITDIWLVIVQPRARDVEEVGAVKPWQMDPIEVINFGGEIEAAVKAAKVEGAPLVAGSWCRWCDAAAVCPAKEEAVLVALELNFLDSVEAITAPQLPPLEVLGNDKTPDGPARIGRIIAGIEVLNNWANQVREYAEAHMVAGNLVIPGWKVVDKIGRRKWVADDDDIVACMELYGLDTELVAPRKLVTITEAEKLLKASGTTKEDRDAFMLSYTIKESSGVTIARDSDRRVALDAIASRFEGVKGNFGQ